MAKSKNDQLRLSLLEADVTEQAITDTLETNYMPYVMSVIISRAIPSIDGFKPAHRKLLYTMFKMGLLTEPRTKSANVVGQTMHLNPHGDAAIYETMVRLTRGNESLLHPFVDSKGSFGKQYSRDMAYAASRYTEVKLDAFAAELFSGIDKDAVDFIPNYDNTTVEPTLLPTTFPNILVSPNLGIAVGMACSICSFNLAEVCDGTIALLRNPDLTVDKLMTIIKAPDFPGGGVIIYDKEQMRQIYETGVGSIRVRARYSYDRKSNALDILQIPYSTSIEAIMKKVTELVRDGKMRAITDIRDAIDLNGSKLLSIDLRRDTDPDKLMLKLFKLTTLEDTFDCNFNLLINDTPMQMGVLDILKHWIAFRMQCLKRELTYTLNKKQDRLHLLLGLATILLDIDKSIRIIRSTEKEQDVVPNLMAEFNLSEKQAEYIAEIKLRHLNREYILNRISDIEELQKDIAELEECIKDDLKVKTLIANQLQSVKKKYGKTRKTQLISASEVQEADPADLVDSYMVQAVLTREGYFKKISRQSLRGNDEHRLKEGDSIIFDSTVDNASSMLIFTTKGNIHKLSISDYPETKASMLGDFIPPRCGMSKGELPKAAVCVPRDITDENILLLYDDGQGIKLQLSAFDISGKKSRLFFAVKTVGKAVGLVYEDDTREVLLKTENGRALIFSTSRLHISDIESPEPAHIMTMKSKDKVNQVSVDEEEISSIPTKARKGTLPSAGIDILDL